MTNWCIQQAGFSSTKKIPPRSWRVRTNPYLRPRRNGKRWAKFRMSYSWRAWFEMAADGCFITALPTNTSALPPHQYFKMWPGGPRLADRILHLFTSRVQELPVWLMISKRSLTAEDVRVQELIPKFAPWIVFLAQ